MAELKANVDDVARRAVELTCEAVPAYAASLDARGRRLCEEDAGFHLQALIGSVVTGDVKIFGDYAVWCAELLSHFGIAAENLAALFRSTQTAIAELVPSAADEVRPHLENGERALAG
jgi:hypothetical protein